MKGHLLASACALSLLIAAPAFAAGGAGMNNGATPMNGSGMNGDSTMGTPGAAGSMNGAGNGAGAGMEMHQGNGMQSEKPNGGMAAEQSGMSHTNRYNTRSSERHSYSRKPATSQDAEVDRLNEESLRAAQQNRAFNPGGGNGEQGGMNQSGSSMAPGAGGGSGGGMQQPMQR